jgi:heme-degrading monooxygenase HmoA
VAAIVTGRQTASAGRDVVVFLIGMRINQLRRVQDWVPVFVAMPRMLRELAGHPELGLLHAQTFVSGRTIQVVQYWRSAQDLHAYSRSTDHQHLPAWRAFNRRARGNSSVGIFHETYLAPASAQESIAVNMPPSGLLAALGSVPVGRRGESAAHRLDPTKPDEQVVPS